PRTYLLRSSGQRRGWVGSAAPLSRGRTARQRNCPGAALGTGVAATAATSACRRCTPARTVGRTVAGGRQDKPTRLRSLTALERAYHPDRLPKRHYFAGLRRQHSR